MWRFSGLKRQHQAQLKSLKMKINLYENLIRPVPFIEGIFVVLII